MYTKVNHSRVLHEIRLFIQTETQRSVQHRAVVRKTRTISIRYTEIEQRLTSVLDDAEVCETGWRKSIYSSHSMVPFFSQQYDTEIRAGISMSGVSVKADLTNSPQSQESSSNLMNSTDVVKRFIDIYSAIIDDTHILSFPAMKCFQMPDNL